MITIAQESPYSQEVEPPIEMIEPQPSKQKTTFLSQTYNYKGRTMKSLKKSFERGLLAAGLAGMLLIIPCVKSIAKAHTYLTELQEPKTNSALQAAYNESFNKNLALSTLYGAGALASLTALLTGVCYRDKRRQFELKGYD